ncbi:holliday junction ATP-dependent DNA helicase RuvA [Eubacterium sp. CAG:786]|nr:holliday junction ATP-dependent DNA helicase RuvA [Eubacterium sp. CAG:786]
MIYSLHGELIHTEPNLAVVECGGVGYACRTTMNTLKKIGSSGEVRLFTQLNVREDAIDLFGFADTAELQAFRQLTSISGVGPKAALSILSDITPSKLALCITTGDSKTLTRSPGIGAKIAQRIVMELKDKVTKEQHISAADYVAEPAARYAVADPAAAAVSGGNAAAEAVTALCVLGFQLPQAQAALVGASPDSTVEELIKYALKRLG